jgi:hypothetical protein
MCWYVEDNATLDFLHKMSKDPVLRAAYRKNPAAVIKKHKLPKATKDALLSENKGDLFKSLFTHDTLSAD